MSKKRIYSLEDLYNLISSNKVDYNFNSDKTGYQLSVQVPAQFEVMKENGDDSLLFCKVKLMHSGENRNHSNVTDDALTKASKTLAYKPILANFMEYTDENGETLKDFTSHDMELNEDGTTTYFEKQVGCFTSDDPYFEVEEDTGHNFLYGYCAIPVGYTDAASIIERKGGTKVSVELAVNELSYNVETHVLDLTDVVILGATCLGKNPTTLEDVGEGMKNARLDIVDFSIENNGVINRYDKDMFELRERLEKLESICFNKNEKDNQEKGGNENRMNMLEKLLTQYNKTIDDITFDYSELSDEELEAKFLEMFSDDTDSTAIAGEGTGEDQNSSNDDNQAVSDGDGDNGSGTTAIENSFDGDSNNGSDQTFEVLKREFSVSHEDIKYALYNLLSAIESDENDWYYITNVYDDYFVYENWDGNKIFGQKYSVKDDSVTFDGDRYILHKEYLTDSEYAELNDMRANYAAISEKLSKYEEAESIADKMTVFDDPAYANYLESDEFKNLMNNDIVKKFTKEELAEKADAALGRLVKTTKNFSFGEVDAEPAQKKPKNKVSIFSDFDTAKDQNVYGDYFKSLN
jgi:hypothetical protein|nr:MAG TPA: hypothetical protein [Caudoviricetes sp.]DAZ34011.1 MAG TPA: hypothetical protein [Caudoviricetes sp.]DAZ46034.1 MAG TPA: hypothetical protein [Caudoviricetes sp.]